MSTRLCLFLGTDAKAIALNPTHIESICAKTDSKGANTEIVMVGGEGAGLYRVRDPLPEVLAAVTGQNRATIEDMIAFKEGKPR